MADGNKDKASAPSKSTLIPLAQVKPGKGEAAPRAVVFPDGTRREPKTGLGLTWRGLPLAVAEWLVSQGKQRPDTKIVRPVPTGLRRAFQLSNGLWIDLHLSAEGCVSRARQLCVAGGIDPAQVLVER